MITLAEQSVARVKTWLADQIDRRHQIAKDAGVDEKTIRLSTADNWDPRASTLRKLEAVIPPDTKKRTRAA
jgi:hypothetical protein